MKLTRLKRAILAGGAALALLAAPGAVWADTLTDTLIKAYQMSPILESARAGLRATDEGVAQARSGRRPRVSADGTAELRGSSTDDFDPTGILSAGLNASLLLYDHGQTEAAIEAAKAVVAATRAELTDVEQSVLLQAVTAFMDIRRDIQSVAVGRNNVTVLTEQVRATTDRFDLGEVTRTDVSLSEARLAAARAGLAAFQGQLAASRELYRAVVGVPAENLQPPPPLPPLPATLDEAEAIAMREHPALFAARYNETAAEFDLRRARGARGPNVSLSSNLTVRNAEDLLGDRDTTTSAGIALNGTVPIYRGGELSSLVRQAESVLAQRKSQVQSTARTIRQDTGLAWANLNVARASIAANREQVRAARVAFQGVREEATLGARTTLDVLDLEQDLRNAELDLASSQRDEYVAAYRLLSAMGLLTVQHLGLGIPTYDPNVNYSRVQNAPYSTVEGTILDKIRDRYSR